MQTFGFIHNVPAIDYPDDTKRISIGSGYTFAADPVIPVYRTIRLMMYGLEWFLDASGAIDNATEAHRNAQALAEFYEEHRLNRTFKYDLDGEGLINVRFNDPLKLPRVEGNRGVLPPFEITLVEDD